MKLQYLRERLAPRQVPSFSDCSRPRHAIYSVNDAVILMISSTNNVLTYELNWHNRLSRR
jgi:hypothetical protein